ncbi:MAG: PEP-CTERM sorting domain-containing protein [Planctomycetia bacterium]|nr:PEP-CTERM sorting domain-containing protein [Planctomycetia bacterium]
MKYYVSFIVALFLMSAQCLVAAEVVIGTDESVTSSNEQYATDTDLVKRGDGTFTLNRSGGNGQTINSLVVESGTLVFEGGAFEWGVASEGYFSKLSQITVNDGAAIQINHRANINRSTNIFLNGGTLTFNQQNYSDLVTLQNGALVQEMPNTDRYWRSQGTVVVSGDTGSTITARLCLVNMSNDNTMEFNVGDTTSDIDLDMSGQIYDHDSGLAGTVVVKNGLGTMRLSNNASSWTGGIQLNAGVLEFTNVNALGTGTVAVGTGATLLSSVAAGSSVRNAVGAAGGTLQTTGGGGYTSFAGISGSGELTLNGAALFSSGTNFSGTLKLAADAKVSFSPASVVNGTVDLQTNGLMELEGSADGAAYSVRSLAGTGTVTRTGTGSATLTIGSGITDSTISETFAGVFTPSADLHLVKAGSGTLTFNRDGGNGGAVGSLTVNAGKLVLSGSSAADPSGRYFGNTPMTVNSGATLEFACDYSTSPGSLLTINGGTVHYSAPQNYQNNITISNGGKITAENSRGSTDTNSFRVGTPSGEVSAKISATAGTSTIQANIRLVEGDVEGFYEMNVAQGAVLQMSGVFADYDGTYAGLDVKKTGAGTLTLTHLGGNGDIAGKILVAEGTLVINADGLAANSAGYFTKPPIEVSNGAKLEITKSWGINNTLVTLSGEDAELVVNANTYANNLTLNDGADISGTNQLRGGYTSLPVLNVGGTGTGSVINASQFMLVANANLDYWTLNVGDTGATYDLDIQSQMVDHTGLEGLGIKKTGAGTLRIANTANNFWGSTIVEEGTLRVEGASLGVKSETRAKKLTIAADASIDARDFSFAGDYELYGNQNILISSNDDGTYAANTIKISGDGYLDPGASFTLLAESVFDVDWLMDNPLTLIELENTTYTTGSADILNIDLAAGIELPSSTFLYGAWNAEGNLFQLHVDAASVPEPSTWLLLLTGFAGVTFLSRSGWKRSRGVAARFFAGATIFTLLSCGVAFGQVAYIPNIDVSEDGTTTLSLGISTTAGGLSGSGTWTLTTNQVTLNDTTTYATLRFSEGAALSHTETALYFGGARLDLNGNSISFTSVTDTYGDSNDFESALLNTSETLSTLTLTTASTLSVRLGNTDATSNKIKLVWKTGDTDTTGEKIIDTKQFHSGGTEVSNGVLQFYNRNATDGTTDYLGTGDITLNNVQLQAFGATTGIAYSLSNDITYTGDLLLRMRSSATLNLSGGISGSGELQVAYDGSAVTLSGSQKTYTGKTVVGSTNGCWANNSASAQLNLGANNVLPTTTTIEIGSTYRGGTLDLAGYSQEVAALVGGGNKATIISSTAGGVLSATDVSGTFNIGTGATLSIAGGTHSFEVAGDGTLAISDDTTINSAYQAAWGKTTFAGNGNDISSAANPTEWQANMDEVNTTSTSVFPNNTTMSFSGYFIATADTDLSFMKNFDDHGYVWVTPVNEDGSLGTKTNVIQSGSGDTGTLLLDHSSGVWGDVVVGEVSLAEGQRYFVEVRVGQGVGGVGPSYSGNTLGIGVKEGANATLETLSEYSTPAIDANGCLAGITTLESIAPLHVSSNISIADGKTLTLQPLGRGDIYADGDISGKGALVLDAQGGYVSLKGENSYAGGTTINAKEVTIAQDTAFGTGAVVFDSATEVVLDSSSSPLGWMEGTIAATGIDKTTVPSDLTLKKEAEYTRKSPGEYTTRAYFSSRLTTDESFTMYFGEAYDDAVYLKITDLTNDSIAEVLNNDAWATHTSGSYDFVAGHLYEIELRVYNGNGGAGPVAATSGNTMPTGVGVGASITSATMDSSYVHLDFDDNNYLAGSSLYTDYSILPALTFSNELTLNDDVMFRSQNNREMHFNGKITGAGALSLADGRFRLSNSESAFGGLTISNSTYQMGEAYGLAALDGDLTIVDSTLEVDLTGLEGAENFVWLKVSGDVSVENSDLVFNFTGDPTSMVTTLTLFDLSESTTDLPENFWQDMDVLFTNPSLYGYVYSDANGFYVTFGNEASIPEPSTWLLLLLGVGLVGLRHRSKKMATQA